MFTSVGASRALKQDRQLRQARPVEATVRSVDLESRRSSSSNKKSSGTTTRYRPRVRFDYAVDGRPYTADTVTVLKEWDDLEWAQSVIARYHAGQRVTAYYDPAEPKRSFLERTRSFSPYLFGLFPCGHLAIGLGLMFGRRLGKRTTAGIIAATWYVIGVPLLLHYFVTAAAGEVERSAKIVGVLYPLLGLIPIVIWLGIVGRREAVPTGEFVERTSEAAAARRLGVLPRGTRTVSSSRPFTRRPPS